MKQLFLKIASLIYGFGLRIRHLMFDIGMLHSTKYDIPIICVGNITVGGTGKTPTVELLVAHFSKSYNIAVLSRGYKRATKGYMEVSVDNSYRDVGDEPLQIKRKFPSVTVVVCAERTYAIEHIMTERPDINLIIMDDGFQHRYVEPFINIIMVDATRPIERDNLLPYGQLRDTADSLSRANYFLVTKCPDDMTPIDARIMRKVLVKAPYQSLYFTKVIDDEVRPVFGDITGSVKFGSEVIAMCGIGNNTVFIDGLKRKYDVVYALEFEDHHAYRICDLKLMQLTLAKYPKAVIITTEKDAVKLYNSTKIPPTVRERLFFENVRMVFIDNLAGEFLNKLDNDLKQRNNETYIRGC